VLEKLAHQVNYSENTIWVIHNKTVPLSVLYHLAKHPDPKIRWAVALKRKLDESLFIDLSQNIYDDVRRQIAYNKKTPMFIIEKLAQDASERVAEVARERLEKYGRASASRTSDKEKAKDRTVINPHW